MCTSQCATFKGGCLLSCSSYFICFQSCFRDHREIFLLSLYAKHCSKSHCRRDALPKSSHPAKTLGLYQIFLDLPKALSTVILHFVRLLFFFPPPVVQILKERFYQPWKKTSERVSKKKGIATLYAVWTFDVGKD